MQRPQEIQQLASVIDRLVTCGGARVANDASSYLQHVGVATVDAESDWMWPTQQFLRHALPASDSKDLLRRVVLRDARYRLHIDLLMCSVIHAVAVSERWRRLEELMFGRCQRLAPRFAQLLTWLSAKLDEPIRDLSSSKLQQAIAEHSDSAFSDWDLTLWGDSRSAADLFPLLLDLYVPLEGQPCHVGEGTPVNHNLLASLIQAANDGEGLILSSDNSADLQTLQNYGLPIRVETKPNHALFAYLVGTIELVADEIEKMGEQDDVHPGLTNNARSSRRMASTGEYHRWSVQRELSTLVFAPVSFGSDALRWPAESLSDAPEWLQLPGSDVISTAAKRRDVSQAADGALQQIAVHPLYGFALQLFLMEALDRELGEETLALALPQNRKLETAEDWAETKVLYRPREESGGNQNSDRDGFLVLGSFDEVIPKIAREVGIEGIATPYKSEHKPWSRAVYLMSTAGIVDGRPHSWRLTITTFILDRLHSGTLMKDVIRGGRAFRETMHQVLLELWKEETANAREEQIPA